MKSLSELTPYLMLSMYITLFCFKDFDYYREHENIFAAIDTVLLFLSFSSAIFLIKFWKPETIITLSTVIVLNILTEFHIRWPIESYYDFYENIIINHFLLMMVLFLIKNKSNNDNSPTLDPDRKMVHKSF